MLNLLSSTHGRQLLCAAPHARYVCNILHTVRISVPKSQLALCLRKLERARRILMEKDELLVCLLADAGQIR